VFVVRLKYQQNLGLQHVVEFQLNAISIIKATQPGLLTIWDDKPQSL